MNVIVDDPSRLPIWLPVIVPTSYRPRRQEYTAEGRPAACACACCALIDPRNCIPLNAGCRRRAAVVKSSPTNKFVEPLIVVVPVPLAAPKPTVFPVTVWLNPLVDTRMPEYFRAVTREDARRSLVNSVVGDGRIGGVGSGDRYRHGRRRAWKKSKMLLLSMRLPVLWFGLADPSDITPLVGRLAPAGPIALLEIVLLLFAPPVEVLIRMLPPAVVVLDVDEPSTVHL